MASLQYAATHTNPKYPRRSEVVELLRSEESQPTLSGVWLRKSRMAKLAAKFYAAVSSVNSCNAPPRTQTAADGANVCAGTVAY